MNWLNTGNSTNCKLHYNNYHDYYIYTCTFLYLSLVGLFSTLIKYFEIFVFNNDKSLGHRISTLIYFFKKTNYLKVDNKNMKSLEK
jgi:hypothetical protein